MEHPDFEWNFNSDEDSLSNEPVHFHLHKEHPLADLLLPQSNSLHRHAKFSTDPQQYQFQIHFAATGTKDQPNHLFTLLNRHTMPSQKLLPEISLKSIYSSMKDVVAMETKARNALQKMEQQVDMSAQMDIGDEEIEIPDDFLDDLSQEEGLPWQFQDQQNLDS